MTVPSVTSTTQCQKDFSNSYFSVKIQTFSLPLECTVSISTVLRSFELIAIFMKVRVFSNIKIFMYARSFLLLLRNWNYNCMQKWTWQHNSCWDGFCPLTQDYQQIQSSKFWPDISFFSTWKSNYCTDFPPLTDYFLSMKYTYHAPTVDWHVTDICFWHLNE